MSKCLDLFCELDKHEGEHKYNWWKILKKIFKNEIAIIVDIGPPFQWKLIKNNKNTFMRIGFGWFAIGLTKTKPIETFVTNEAFYLMDKEKKYTWHNNCPECNAKLTVTIHDVTKE
jgi:hypothetical protein